MVACPATATVWLEPLGYRIDHQNRKGLKLLATVVDLSEPLCLRVLGAAAISNFDRHESLKLEVFAINLASNFDYQSSRINF